DVRSLRIRNWLNAAGLVLALALAGWLGGLLGFGTALIGAGAALAIGFALFALGVIGAGDAKGVAVLGALFGLSALPGVLWWTALAAGTLGIALILARGEAIDFVRRWWLMALAFLVTRKPFYMAPARESAAATGLPFAIAMGLGTAASGVWGTPWSG
ncbi:MAG: prepilin peptidase, partial [Myxococcota bacterium]